MTERFPTRFWPFMVVYDTAMEALMIRLEAKGPLLEGFSFTSEVVRNPSRKQVQESGVQVDSP